MDTALWDLRLSRLLVVYPGERAYDLTAKASVCPLGDIEKQL
jgi:hypothetical protein